jgi:hypothetical protein
MRECVFVLKRLIPINESWNRKKKNEKKQTKLDEYSAIRFIICLASDQISIITNLQMELFAQIVVTP